MDTGIATTMSTVSAALAAIAALAAVVVAVRAEMRSSLRFQRQLESQQSVAAAQAIPILAVFTSGYVNLKAITLENLGSGVAIITDVSFHKGEGRVRNLAELFELPEGTMWDTWWRFPDAKSYLKEGSTRRLIELSLTGLEQQGIAREKALRILEDWQRQLEGVTVEIAYRDVFGNEQEPCVRTFHS